MAQDLTAQYQQIIDSDPVIQALLERYRSNTNAQDWFRILNELDARASELRKQIPELQASDYKINPTSGKVKRDSFLERNAEWAIPGLLGGAALGGGALFGGVGAAGGAGGSAATSAGISPSLIAMTEGGAKAISPSLIAATEGGAAGLSPAIANMIGTAGAGGAGGIGSFFKGLGGSDLIGPAVTAALPLLGRAFSGGPASGPTTGGGFPPELNELLQDAMRRMRAQEPLFNAVSQQAHAGLPDYVKRGG